MAKFVMQSMISEFDKETIVLVKEAFDPASSGAVITVTGTQEMIEAVTEALLNALVVDEG